MQNIWNQYGVSQNCMSWELASCQQLPGNTRKSWTGFSSRWELDSGMHRLESGSGLQAGQGAGSSSEAGHGRREKGPHDPQALNWAWHTWHGIPRWSALGYLFCSPIPTSMTLYHSSVAEHKWSIHNLGCYGNTYKHGFFLHSIPTFSSVELSTLGVISSRTDIVCKICSQLQKTAVT